VKRLLLITALLFSSYAFSQNALVHINAKFNSSNDWYGLQSIDKAKVYSGYIESNPSIKDRYTITKVPTLILYKDGEEVQRWEGGLDMKLHVTTREVQDIIDRF